MKKYYVNSTVLECLVKMGYVCFEVKDYTELSKGMSVELVGNNSCKGWRKGKSYVVTVFAVTVQAGFLNVNDCVGFVTFRLS